MTKKTLIIGPQPPAIGGIASIVSLLNEHLTGVQYMDSTKPNGGFSKTFHPIILLMKLFFFCLFNPGSKVLFFSSAYQSFWEKSCWALIVRVLFSRVYLVMVDGNFPEFYQGLSERKKRLAQFFMKNVTVVAQSPSWQRFYEEIFPSSKFGVISGGVDTDFFQSNGYGSKSKRLNVLYVGWVIKEKGVYDILEACSLLKESFDNFTVELVGPLYLPIETIDELIKSYGLEDVIKICGPIQGRSELRDKYCSSDIFLFPSHYEGFPMAVLEALSCGLPMIASNVGGIPDIVNEGINGFLIEPRSPESISKALSVLLTDEKLRLSMSEESRKSAISKFSISLSAESYRTLLDLTKD